MGAFFRKWFSYRFLLLRQRKEYDMILTNLNILEDIMKKITALLLALSIALILCFTGCSHFSAPEQSYKEVHFDTNNDGICDECGTSVIVTVDFYAVNDLHGKFADTNTQPGVDELTTYLKSTKFTDEHTVFLSSGDMWQGSSESNLTKGLIVTDWMNELGFAAMTLGNHEYDWGEEYIVDNKELAQFPFLALNVYDTQTDSRVDYCEASVLIERGNAKIGIIGAMGDCYSSIASDHTKGVYFLVGEELTELVKQESIRLKNMGADYIVYSIHDGYGGKDYGDTITSSAMAQYYDSVLSDTYVDLVFEAHTHKYYVKEDSEGVFHLQGGGDNRGISHAEVSINIANNTGTVNEAEFVGTEKYQTFSDDPIVEQLLEKYDDQVSIGKEQLGYNAYGRDSYELRSTAAMLYYEYGQMLWGDQFDIVLGGGFFTVRSPGSLNSGNVTYSQLQMLFPFDNYLTLCSVSGRDLQEKFFETDNSNYFIYYGDYGDEVRRNLDPNGTYYIVVDSYTSTYKYNRLTEIIRLDEELFTRDLLAEFIQNGGYAN